MTYDELVAHARKFNRHALVPAFDPCEKSYIVELVRALDTIKPVETFAANPTLDMIDSLHVGVGEALFNYCATTDSYYNGGEHNIEYVLALYSEIGDTPAIEEFRAGLADVLRGDNARGFTSIYDIAVLYCCFDGDRACYLICSDEEGCEMWLVFTVEPKHIG